MPFRFAACEAAKDLTQQGQEQLDEILGLKRFLLDFSLIRERGIKETVLWQDYLICATCWASRTKLCPRSASSTRARCPRRSALSAASASPAAGGGGTR